MSKQRNGHQGVSSYLPAGTEVGESWAIKKRLRAKELMLSNCGAGELLRVPWTARRSNQSSLKESTLNIHWKD